MALPNKLNDARELLEARSLEVKTFIEKLQKEGSTTEQRDELKKRNDELAEINDHVMSLYQVEVAAKNVAEIEAKMAEVNRPAMPGARQETKSGAQQEQQESVGDQFIKSKAYTDLVANKPGDWKSNAMLEDFDPGMAMKTTFATGAGFAPPNNRTDIVIVTGTPNIVIQDLIPSITTDLDAIKYMDETTFTNNAAGTSENAAMTESAIAYTERSQGVELIGTFLPVTEQQMEIATAVRGLIDGRLMKMYQLKEQQQILAGSGASPELLGFLNKPSIQTQAKGADSVPACLYKLITKLRGGSASGFVEPSAFVLHPNDWQDIRLLTDANGQFLWGPPSEPGPERVWGKPVVATPAITENTGLCGDFAGYSQIWRKRGARIDTALVNDDFIKNKVTIKITGRLALVIYRASAFGLATGI